MCAVLGIIQTKDNTQNIGKTLFNGLTILQHRGQDSCGISTIHHNTVHTHKAMGMVHQNFGEQSLAKLQGNIGIGHVRYPTSGDNHSSLAQPFYAASPYGIVFAHNGNIYDTKPLKDIASKNCRHINTNSDSELMLSALSHELYQRKNLSLLNATFDTVTELNKSTNGAFACVFGIIGLGLVAIRDQNGIRPLCIGKKMNKNNEVVGYIFASESSVFNSLGYQLYRDVKPGECVIIDEDLNETSQICATNTQFTPCIFEHIYFARPDSIMDGMSIYDVRLNQGRKLANSIKKYKSEWLNIIDVIIPIPDTSRVIAQSLAEELNIKLREGLIKNRYSNRTFIMGSQNMRKEAIQLKLSPIISEIKGKRILLVDDSIVRGNTSKLIIEMCRKAGATEVYLCSGAPPIKYPNFYGIDIPSVENLAAYQKTNTQICNELGCDGLHYQSISDLIAASKEIYDAVKAADAAEFNAECSVFNNKHPVINGATPNDEVFRKTAAERSDKNLSKSLSY